MTQSSDSLARKRALNPKQSFIVQAPAGSGKTELLTQRFLRLLKTVASPEEIIAITFTRKAAAEMRHRIISALRLAQSGETPQLPHKQVTFDLASKALLQDQQHNWKLLQNPNRLRILTIDSLAGYLSAQIPILAGFGAKPDISDDAQYLYLEATRELLLTLSDDTPWQHHLKTLLLHLDNNLQRASSLLCRILAKREQWLPHILGYLNNADALHQHLNDGLLHIAEDAMALLQQHIDSALASQLSHLAQLAAHNLNTDTLSHPLAPFTDGLNLNFTLDSIDHWRPIVDLFLTQKDDWRKSVTKRNGFPAKTPEKAQFSELLKSVSGDDDLKKALLEVRHCPQLSYPPSQTSMIDALSQLLPILYAQLKLTFQKYSQIDFVELNLAALRALGDDDAATDLALYLDYQIRHLLIDEFQDTSITQFSLIERLIRGWEPEDGRSLFLVGDPMQSIYRFRDAEVGLFLKAEQNGINELPLEKLTLTHNYRSDDAIIDWVNQTFQHLFPKSSNITEGAITYSSSVATRFDQSPGVFAHALTESNTTDEAQYVAQLVADIQQRSPHDSIAILVRSRSHLSAITPALNELRINYQAVDLQTLTDCPEIQELITLTRALCHRHDSIAWYGLLRSPICGLTLADLHLLAQHFELSVWHTLTSNTALLSQDGQHRCQHLITCLTLFFNEQGRKPFDLALKGLWQALGYQELLNSQQQSNATLFFPMIAELWQQHRVIDIDSLMQRLQKTYIEPKKVSSQLAIMTIHKSKGLEFDHVIIPGLHNKAMNNHHDIMLWLERPTLSGNSDLILAPIKQHSADKDAIYHYLQRIETQKLQHELTRLLYVAVTRAKNALYLTACLEQGDDGNLITKTGSFAALLQGQFTQHHIETSPTTLPLQDTTPKQLHRVPHDWQPLIQLNPNTVTVSDNPLPDFEDPFKRLTGTIIHEYLQDYVNATVKPSYLYRLRQIGLNPNKEQQALTLLETVTQQIAQDTRAQWILDSNHTFSKTEYPLTLSINKKQRHLIVDRCFIDGDTLWVIDYKTAIPSKDEDLNQFLSEQKQQYQEQLTTYATALKPLHDKDIKLALYFPLCRGWIEWSYDKQFTASHT